MADADLNIDTIFDASLDALLRTTIDLESGDPLSADYGPDDIATETRAELREEIEEFVEENGDDLREALASGTGYTQEKIGDDIVHTRNHHGAGFWDRGLGSVGTRLTEAGYNLGSMDLYPFTDGTLRA